MNFGLCTPPPVSSFVLLSPPPHTHKQKRKRKRRMNSYRLFRPHPTPPPIMQVPLAITSVPDIHRNRSVGSYNINKKNRPCCVRL
jgi:hypothetical protein